MTDEVTSKLRRRQERAAEIAERASIIPAEQSGEIQDPEQDAASRGNRGAPGVIPVRVASEFVSRRLFDLHASLQDGYVAK